MAFGALSKQMEDVRPNQHGNGTGALSVMFASLTTAQDTS